MRAQALAALAMLTVLPAAMCTTTAPPVNDYCPKRALERVDFTDPGIYGLSAPNKRALIIGEENYKADCLLGDRTKSLGPR